MRIVLLPGLDGTAKLFNRFIASLPNGQTVLIAESFSGPLALALAARRPFAGLVFCNSFVVAPRSRTLRWLTLPALFTLPLPDLLLRRYMLGAGADDKLVRELAAAVASVPSSVLASRVQSVLTVDDASAFARCAVPTLYVRGTEDRLVPDSALGRMAAERNSRSRECPVRTSFCRRIPPVPGG